MIVVASPAPIETWNRIAELDRSATFFQTPAWARVVSSMDRGFRDDSMLMRLEDGARAVLPRMTRTRGVVFQEVEAVPVGLYGAPLCERPLAPNEMLSLAACYRPALSAGATLTETPGVALDFGVRRESASTRLLRWPAGSAVEAIAGAYRKSHRNAISHADRMGVHVSLAQNAEDFERYYGLYLQTFQRWTRRPIPYPPAVFQALGQASQTDARIRLWLGRVDGQLVAGALALHHGSSAAYWHGASNDEGRRRSAGNAVVHAAIADAVCSAKVIFDFMPSAGLPEVEQFKAGFGAEEVPVGIHHFETSRIFQTVTSVRARLRRSR